MSSSMTPSHSSTAAVSCAVDERRGADLRDMPRQWTRRSAGGRARATLSRRRPRRRASHNA
eukprot:7805020-Pyramimonas_sp.AAC.1